MKDNPLAIIFREAPQERKRLLELLRSIGIEPKVEYTVGQITRGMICGVSATRDMQRVVGDLMRGPLEGIVETTFTPGYKIEHDYNGIDEMKVIWNNLIEQ